MNKPRKHHFVSQVHMRHFARADLLYVYDKIQDKCFPKKSLNDLFAERDGNTRYNSGERDFHSLEIDLKTNFEDYLNEDVKQISKLIEYLSSTYIEEKTIVRLAQFGVIGELRTARHKKAFDDQFYKAYMGLANQSTSTLRQEIIDMFQYRDHVKYDNTLDYSQISKEMVKLMGDLHMVIEYVSEDSDYLVLPDCTSISERAQINEYPNPNVKEMAYTGYPLTSKIYTHFFSKKLFETEVSDVQVREAKSERVLALNKISILACQKQVVCENHMYLEQLIQHFKMNPNVID